MTKRSSYHVVVFALALGSLLAALAILSCGRADAPRPQSADPGIRDSVRHESTNPSASSLSPDKAAVPRPTVQDSVREKLLRRKGELLMAQKRVRNSDNMTLSQKDSALRAIEEESIELSKKLLEAGQ